MMEKYRGGGLNDNVDDTPSTKQEETEESGGTDETIVPDKNTDDTEGEEGGAGENTSPEGEDEETEDAGHEENGTDAAVQALLARIDALPDAEEYLAAEPDVEDEDAYAAWEEKLYEYAEEALSIMEEYETLTKEQQAFISGEELAKLTAWTEIAEIAGESAQVMATASHSHSGISFDTPLPADGGRLTSGNYYLDGDVTLKDYISISSSEEVKLCLNGNTLNGPDIYDAINVYGTLHIYDCQGRGVFHNDRRKAIDNSGTFNLYSGTITSNYSCVITTSGTCNLSGGIVEGGSEEQILNSKTLTISGDTVVRGGKYAVFNNGRDGTVLTVKDNAQLSGEERGVYNLYGAFNIEGGTITGQKYGIYQGPYATVSYLSGSPKVSGQEADLYLHTRIDTTLENVKVDAVSYSGAALTVMEDATNGRKDAYAIKVSEGNKDKFTLLNEGWLYAYKDGGLIIHEHSYKYKASTEKGNVVIESCTCGHEETATLSLQKNADLTYTGSGIKPVTVSYSDGWVGTGSSRPGDSRIRYSSNINVGQATASLTIGLSAQASLNFTIAAASMDDAAITLADGALTYNGQEQTKEVTNVTVNGRTLIPGTDYTIVGNTGTDAGEYTITVTGRMNYSGTRQITFQILRKTLTADMVTIAPGPHYYTGNAVTPDITVRDGSTVLLDGTDYTVSYAANVNPGPATVRVTGKGNYTGTVNQTFTIECRELPSGNLTDYVDMSSSPNEDGWYCADIVLTPKDGYSVGKTPGDIGDSVVISEETGTDGETKTIYIKDGAGNIYQAQFPYKLDKTPPVTDLSHMTVENGTKDLGNWIIGKKSMRIKIPAGDITDTPSGIEEVTYETAPDSGTGQSGTLLVKGGYYEIALNAEFSGIIRLTARDRAGNTTQVSLTAAGGKVIAEDYAPVVNITLPDTPQPNADGWYSETFDITVTVTDDKDSGNNNITSGGIAEIKWKDGESGPEQTAAGLPGTTPVYSKIVKIPVDTDGTHTYYVQATDNAGNESGWQTVTVRIDISNPKFSGDVSVTNRTEEGADITFTPSEGGKAYWIVSDTGTAPGAQDVIAGAQGGAGKGGVRDVTGSMPDTFTVTGLTSGEKHTVYVVLEDAAGNLSVVKEVTFTTLQKAPEITLRDLDIDYEKETVRLPDSFGDAEVYTNPEDPAGSKIEPGADGSLPVEPGTPVYVRYPEKTEDGETTPASGGAKIDIPGRPAAPAPKKTAVTDTTVTVTDPAAGEEYILVEKGSLPEGADPDWDNADKVNETGVFTRLDPNKEYELYVRKKATQDYFASESAKTEVRTYVTIEESNVTGEGAGQTENTALTPDAPDGDGDTVTFTGTYGEEYTPVIKVDGKEIVPGEGTPGSEMTWDGNSGEWKYTYEIPGGTSNVQITVEFRKRVVTGIAAAPDSLTIYADDAANGSMEALTAYLKDHCNVQTVYDNQTKEIVQEEASFVTTDSFVQKGTAYRYTVSVGGRTCTAALTVQPLTASVQNPDTLRKKRKNGGYTEQEVCAWLPAQATVTYTGTGYTTRTETRAVTWDTSSVGEEFGGVSGEETVGGTVELPAWATGQNTASITIRFENGKPSSSGGSNGGSDNNGGGENIGEDSSGSSGGSENSGSSTAPGNGKNPGKPAVTPPSATAAPPTDAARINLSKESQPTAQTDTPDSRQEDENGQGKAASPQKEEKLSEADSEQPGQDKEQTASMSADDGKIEISGGVIEGEAGSDHASKCALCHICPTFLGVCYFVWLILLAAAVIAAIVVIVVLKRKKETAKSDKSKE